MNIIKNITNRFTSSTKNTSNTSSTQSANPPMKIDGSGHSKTEERKVENFSKIESYGAWNLNVNQSDTESVTITADDNLVEHISTEVTDEVLMIKMADGISYSTQEITIEVTVKTIESLSLKGSGNTSIEKIHTESFVCNLEGSGNIYISGEVQRLAVKISGAGDVDASECVSTQAVTTILGGGNIIINSSDTLTANISGAGNINYLNDPTVTKNITGAGNVSKL